GVVLRIGLLLPLLVVLGVTGLGPWPRAEPVELLLDELHLPSAGEALGIEQGVEGEAVDQAEQALGDVLGLVVADDLAGRLALSGELGQAVDQLEAAAARAGHALALADRAGPVVHEELG